MMTVRTPCPTCDGTGEHIVNRSRDRDPLQEEAEACADCARSGTQIVNVADRVRAIIEKLLPTSAAPVDVESLADRGADYIDLVAIELELGEAFGIRFPPSGELDEVDTVAQVIATVEQLVASRADQVQL